MKESEQSYWITWQMENFGNYIPEDNNDESEVEQDFPKEQVEPEKINGDDDFNFHPDWYYL